MTELFEEAGLPEAEKDDEQARVQKALKEIGLKKSIAWAVFSLLMLAFFLLRVIAAMHDSKALTEEQQRYIKLYNLAMSSFDGNPQNPVLLEVQSHTAKMAEHRRLAGRLQLISIIFAVAAAAAMGYILQLGRTERIYHQTF